MHVLEYDIISFSVRFTTLVNRYDELGLFYAINNLLHRGFTFDILLPNEFGL